LFEQADQIAKKLGKSRSQLYQEALADYIGRLEPESVTRAMDEVCAALDSRPDPWLAGAARRVLERSEW
jgi:hypothetical protein